MENWRKILGYEGFYEVSNAGNVRSVLRTIELRDGSKRTFPGRTLSPRTDRDGYHLVQLQSKGHKRTFRVHRIVLETFVGPCPVGMEAAHDDGTRANNYLSNLLWKTPKANNADKQRHGTRNDGSKNGGARLTADQVIEIRRRYMPYSRENGGAALAREFGIVGDTLHRIIARKSWSDTA